MYYVCDFFWDSFFYGYIEQQNVFSNDSACFSDFVDFLENMFHS